MPNNDIMQAHELMAGAVIHKLGEQIRILEKAEHVILGKPRLEFYAVCGRQKPLWFSAAIVQRWIHDALAIDTIHPDIGEGTTC